MRLFRVGLSAYRGRIDVRSVEADSARVEVRIEGDDSAAVDQTRIRVQSSADRLEIDTDYDEVEAANSFFGLFGWGSTHRPATNYTLDIPRSAGLEVDTYSAATAVTALETDVSARTEPIGDDRVRATVGGGGPALRFDTFSGTLILRRP